MQPTNKCSFGPVFYLHFHSYWKFLGRKWSHYEPSCALSCVVKAVFSLHPVTSRTYLSWHSKNGKIGKYFTVSVWILLLLWGSNSQNMKEMKFLPLNHCSCSSTCSFSSQPSTNTRKIELLLKTTSIFAGLPEQLFRAQQSSAQLRSSGGACSEA